MATLKLYTLSTAVFLRHNMSTVSYFRKNNNSDNKAYRHTIATSCSLFSVFTLFYLILINMSTNGRKCCLPCYI